MLVWSLDLTWNTQQSRLLAYVTDNSNIYCFYDKQKAVIGAASFVGIKLAWHMIDLSMSFNYLFRNVEQLSRLKNCCACSADYLLFRNI